MKPGEYPKNGNLKKNLNEEYFFWFCEFQIITKGKWSGDGQFDPRHSIPGDDLEPGKVQRQDEGPQQDDVEEADQREEERHLAVSGFAEYPLERYLCERYLFKFSA